MRKEFNFTMGADPEFNLIMQNRRIHASSTLSQLLTNDAELKNDEDGMGYQYLNYGSMGWDGANSTAEIRPSPAKTADGLVLNIENIFKKLCEKTPLVDLTPLSYFASVGGHIHFSVPKEFATKRKMNLVHKKLASFYLPLILAENKINLQIRLKSSYGSLSDWRETNYGSQPADAEFNGYEFRTPSAEWLTTKKVALATIAYVGTVYNEIINNPKNIKKFSDLFIQTVKQAEALQQLALSDYKSLTKSIFTQTRNAIRTFEFYPEYKEEIEYILDSERVIKDKTKVNYNIAQGWEIAPILKQPTKKDLVNKKKVAELASKTDLDLVQAMVNISYNNDTNVELFIKALSERIAVFNWKLKNTYFLFGTRKGVENFIVFDNNQSIYVGQDMVQTTGDMSAMDNLMQKMMQKDGKSQYPSTGSLHDVITDIDPSRASKKFFIGIPYDQRVQHDLTPFIHLIYDLENKKLDSFNPTELTMDFRKSLKTDSNNNIENKGKFCQIMTRTSENPQIVFDTSTNERRAQQRIMDAINQLRRPGDNDEDGNPIRQGCNGDPHNCTCQACTTARTLRPRFDQCDCGDCDECEDRYQRENSDCDCGDCDYCCN